MFYDLDRINEDVDAIEIAESLGIPLYGHGKTQFIYCPEHLSRLGKENTKPSSCQITSKGYYCHSCGAKGNAIKLIMDNLHCNLPEAAKQALILSGLPVSEYALDNTNEKPEDVMPLSKNDIKLLSLKNCYAKNCINVSLSKNNLPSGQHIYENVSYLLSDIFSENPVYDIYTKSKYSLLDLWKEDKEGFIFLVSGKIKEAQLEYCSVLDSDIIEHIFSTKTSISLRENLMINLKRINYLATYFQLQQIWPKPRMRKSRFV